ncbi:hypothetical protein Syun_015661 [Stephania yunnanensis]|uniref:BHLH domain-containing protein n=1 Tax=Stephania yunnanensis TaxID=152371 RepID=A0AAP0PD12_9MAGN
MLHSVHTPEVTTVLERQRARLKWQQQQQQIQAQEAVVGQSFFSGNAHLGLMGIPQQRQQLQLQDYLMGGDDGVGRSMKVDPGGGGGGMENGWPDLGPILVDYAISRTSSCPPAVDNAAAAAVVERRGGGEEMSLLPEKILGSNGKKRKAEKGQQSSSKVVVGEDIREKKIKLDEEGASKVTDPNNTNNNNSSNSNNNNRETSADSAKETSKVTEVQKPDYIHVRARRGQATDSHSLAERVRREKISERMKYLQDLVPGCNKITGKAGMLDEIINYVQSLQRQVEFLSMKLAAVNPRLDFNIDNFFSKEMFPSCTDSFATTPISSEVPNCSSYLPFNPVQQVVSCCGFDMVTSPQEMALRRTISAPISAPEALLDTSCFTQVQPTSSPWDTDLQSLYSMDFNQGRPIGFPQSFTGTLEANNLKMEM